MLLAPLLLLSSVAHAGALPWTVHSETLDNGLTVHVVPMDTATGVVSVATWMAVGSRDELDEGRTGFAHFFEHLMFYGTETVTPDEREQRLLRLAVDENAWTWLDETVYHAALAAENLEPYLELEADRFQNLVLTEADVRQEAGAVLGEYRKNLADPGFVLETTLHATAFTEHPYRHDTIGLLEDIEAMPTAYAYSRAFFDRHYRPDKATLLVAGDVEAEATLALIARLYGAWTSEPGEPVEIPVEPEQTELRREHVSWDEPTAPRLTMAWKAPAHDPTDPDVAALELVSRLLLSPVGRLQERLIREEGVAWEVHGGRDDFVDPGLVRIVVRCREPGDLQRAEAIVREEIAALVDEVDADRLDATRTHGRYALLTSLDDPRAVTSTLGWHLRRHPDPDSLDTWLSLLDEVTPGQVSAAAEAWLVDERLTVVTLGPAPEEAE